MASISEQARLLFPWMPESLIDVYEQAFVEFGDNPRLILQEVRNGEGREIYDQTFPGIRREDGTLRMTENEYLSDLAQYRNTLRQRNLNPDVFEDRFVELLQNEVSPDEFEGRVAAVNENIAQQSEEIRQAFAEASGVADFSPQAVLATVLDPDGVGRELLERRISVAQVRGAALESGIDRNEDRVRELVQQGVGLGAARQFYSGAQRQLSQFQTISRAARGSAGPSLSQVEEAVLLQEQDEVANLTRLLQREAAAFGSNRIIQSNRQSGAVTGLRARNE